MGWQFWKKDKKPSDRFIYQGDADKIKEESEAIMLRVKQLECNHDNAEIEKFRRLTSLTVANGIEVRRASVDDWVLKCPDCDKVIKFSTEVEYLKQEYKKAKDALNTYHKKNK